MSRTLPERLAQILEEPITGVIATLRRDGRPYTVPIWWLWKDGFLWLTGTSSRIWCKQLRRDPRMSLCIATSTPTAAHVEVDGRAEWLEPPEFNIWPTSRLLAEKFVGRGDPSNADALDRFFDNMRTEPRVLFRVTPEVWRAIDLSVYRGKRADREYRPEQSPRP
ncbi:MAG TPA: pyridoxamine 5'-phosphate oxidase family protein [Dehalococcoidia bacterium]|jgi:PPOX class probable F420-dependent enzyme|nr:pyridoxamine 5'-phosphate oxidase family protein [Dehalococcoidia bacterium]